MPVRKAAVAGQFYEGSVKACLAQLQEMMPKMLPAGEIAEQVIKAFSKIEALLTRRFNRENRSMPAATSPPACLGSARSA